MPIIKSMIPWTERIYDMSLEQLRKYISGFREEYHGDEDNVKYNREVVNIFYIEYHYWQLRKTHQWVQQQFALSGDRMAVRREILLERIRGSTESPINPEDIDYLIQHMQRATNDILLNDRWRMIVYPHGTTVNTHFIGPGIRNPFNPDIPYMVGVDPSGGGGGDNTSITVVNPYNLQIAAEFKSPYMSGTELLRSLVDLVSNYIPKAVVIPEKNSMGIYLIHNLCESSIRENLYWSESGRELEEMSLEDSRDNELKTMSNQYKKYGVYTSRRVRDAMFELLFKHIAECRQLLNGEYLVDDICKLIRTSTGRIEAGKGEHDDCLMSYLLVCYIYYTGDNLEFFEIDRSKHPIIGVLDPNTTKVTEYSYTAFDILKDSTPTYEEIQKESIIQIEQYSRLARSSRLHFTDDSYDGRGNSNADGTITIDPSFFDLVNV